MLLLSSASTFVASGASFAGGESMCSRCVAVCGQKARLGSAPCGRCISSHCGLVSTPEPIPFPQIELALFTADNLCPGGSGGEESCPSFAMPSADLTYAMPWSTSHRSTTAGMAMRPASVQWEYKTWATANEAFFNISAAWTHISHPFVYSRGAAGNVSISVRRDIELQCTELGPWPQFDWAACSADSSAQWQRRNHVLMKQTCDPRAPPYPAVTCADNKTKLGWPQRFFLVPFICDAQTCDPPDFRALLDGLTDFTGDGYGLDLSFQPLLAGAFPQGVFLNLSEAVTEQQVVRLSRSAAHGLSAELVKRPNLGIKYGDACYHPGGSATWCDDSYMPTGSNSATFIEVDFTPGLP